MHEKTKNSSSSRPDLPLVIVNPNSAGGATRDKWPTISAALSAHFGDFRVAFTNYPGEGIEIARRFADQGKKLIIACGGDGTINEVVNGILLSNGDPQMGILPSGTGGDLRRTLNIPDDFREAAKTLKIGNTKKVDVGKVAFTDDDGKAAQRFFLNISSFGLASSIIRRVKQDPSFDWLPLQTLKGRAEFALSTLKEVVDLGVTKAQISVDDGEFIEIDTINFCIANSRYFGGGMLIAPDAAIDDGLFDLIDIGDISTAKIILNVYTLYRGTHTKLPEVKSRRAFKLSAKPLKDGDIVPIEIDGELPGRLPAVYEILPKRLTVITA